MKKLLKIIYLLLLPLYSTFGQSLIGVSIRDTNMVVGDTIFVPVYVDSTLTGENVSSYNLQFSFNDNYFVVDSAYSDGTLTAGWGDVSYNTSTEERISVAAAGSTDLSGTGILLYLRVRAIRAGTTNLAFTDTTFNYFNEGTPRILLDNGRIAISDKPTIRVNPNSALLTVGDTYQFTVSYGTEPYEWSLTEGTIASIDSGGLLTALSKGSTQVVARDANGIIDTSDGVIEIRPFKLSMRDTSHYQGQIVDIPIYTTDLTGLNYTSGEITLELNESILTPTEIITSGTLLGGYTTPSFGFKDGILQIAFAGDSPIVGEGVLLIVRYQITSENSNNTYINFTNILFNEADLGNGERSYFDTLPLATLNISPNTGTLLAGETLQFNATNGTTPYNWEVSDSAIASIDASGLLTAISGGTLVVSATDVFGGTGSTGNINLYDTEITIPDTSSDVGSTIDLPIYMGSLNPSYSIVSLQTDVLFDSSKVKFDQVVTSSSRTTGWNFSTNNMGNKVTIAGASTTGFNSSGVIVYLRFNVSNNASIGNYSNITLENFLFNEGSPNVRIDNGRINIATTTTPDAPSGLVALQTGETEVQLLWSDNSNNEQGFKIDRKTESSGTWNQITTVSANSTSYSNSGVALGTTYYYRIRAYNSNGNSDYSNEANVTTADGTPTSPTNLRTETDVVDSCSKITAYWLDNSDNELGFYLSRKYAGSDWTQIATVAANVIMHSDSNLTDGTRYYYKILAWNNNGNSDFSNIDSATTVMYKATDAEAVQLQNNAVELTWIDNSQSEDGYIIERANTQTMPPADIFVAIDTVNSGVESVIDSSAVIGASYIYRVKGYNMYVESEYSDSAYITITSVNDLNEIPTRYELSQNYPNPFNPSTVIRYGVPEASTINITIYNLLGEKVECLVKKVVSAGFHEITWNASSVPTGVYLISARLESTSSSQIHSLTKKAILLK